MDPSQLRPDAALAFAIPAPAPGVGYCSFLIKKRWPDAVIFAFEALSRHADALEGEPRV